MNEKKTFLTFGNGNMKRKNYSQFSGTGTGGQGILGNGREREFSFCGILVCSHKDKFSQFRLNVD